MILIIVLLFGLAIWGVFGTALGGIANSSHLSDNAKIILIIGVAIAFTIWWMTL